METVTEDIAVEAMQHTDAAEAGLALRCFGLNLLCRKVIPLADSIASVLEMRVIQANGDYAIIAGPQLAKLLIIQLHADATYHANPLPSLLPEQGAGAGEGHAAPVRNSGCSKWTRMRPLAEPRWRDGTLCNRRPTSHTGCASATCWMFKAIAGHPAV